MGPTAQLSSRLGATTRRSRPDARRATGGCGPAPGRLAERDLLPATRRPATAFDGQDAQRVRPLLLTSSWTRGGAARAPCAWPPGPQSMRSNRARTRTVSKAEQDLRALLAFRDAGLLLAPRLPGAGFASTPSVPPTEDLRETAIGPAFHTLNGRRVPACITRVMPSSGPDGPLGPRCVVSRPHLTRHSRPPTVRLMIFFDRADRVRRRRLSCQDRLRWTGR